MPGPEELYAGSAPGTASLSEWVYFEQQALPVIFGQVHQFHLGIDLGLVWPFVVGIVIHPMFHQRLLYQSNRHPIAVGMTSENQMAAVAEFVPAVPPIDVHEAESFV